MTSVRVTANRTLGRLFSSFHTALAVALFLASSAALFSYNLESAEGSPVTGVALWASSVSVFLPLLAAFLGMDVWSEERRRGTIDALLTAPVRERDFVIGKFAGVFIALISSVVLSAVLAVLSLSKFAPQSLSSFGVVAFLSAFAALALQGAFFCAATTAVSAFFTSAAASFSVSAVLFAALPRAAWISLMSFAPAGRTSFGAFPLDAHVEDCAAGVFPVGAFLLLAVLVFISLYIAVGKTVSLRFVGRRSLRLRAAAVAETCLSVVCAALAAVLAARLDFTFEIPSRGTGGVSPRMRQILSDSSAKVTVTAFLSRRDPRFRTTARFLRSLKRFADPLGGMTIELNYVDPRWDVGPAGRLVRKGAREGSVILETSRKSVVVPLEGRLDERDLVSALRSLVAPPLRKDVCWVTGHGELMPDAYGSWGMSDIARELSREGYRNVTLDLAASQIPSECAMMVIAGAKDDFSRVELGKINEYLKNGGRLLVLMGRPVQGGVSSLLPTWGIRPSARPIPGAKTLSGTDVVVSLSPGHQISAALSGSRIVLERPVVFDKAAVAESGVGADKIEFTPLAGAGESVVAAAVERGAGAGSDLAIRPTRIVVVGDGTFVSNGALAVRSCANRDFLLNIVAYLSGTDAIGASGAEPDILVTGLDRRSRSVFTLVHALAFPFLVFVVLSALVFSRRRGR